MRTIIKHYAGQKFWPMIYCVGDVACELGGMISHAVFEKMLSEGILKEVDQTQIIEKYFRHVTLVLDVPICKYYEIKK